MYTPTMNSAVKCIHQPGRLKVKAFMTCYSIENQPQKCQKCLQTFTKNLNCKNLFSLFFQRYDFFVVLLYRSAWWHGRKWQRRVGLRFKSR